MRSMEPKQFEVSKDLKNFFNKELIKWKKEHRSTLDDLARRCGISSSYLSQVSRYGRIPNKPILILLALNFKLQDPSEILRLAGINPSFWAYPENIGLRENSFTNDFFKISFDETKFSELIRNSFNTSSRKKLDLNQKLQIGLNVDQSFGFHSCQHLEGLFPELLTKIFNVAGLEIDFKIVHFSDCFEKIESGEIDLYAPLYTTPRRSSKLLFSKPLFSSTFSGLWRKKHYGALTKLPTPKKLTDLLTKPYKIAVLSNSNVHHFAEMFLASAESELIVCDSGEEVLDRLSVTGLKRPAHLSLCDASIAIDLHAEYTDYLELLFNEGTNDMPFFSDSIAVKKDRIELLEIINESISFMHQSHSIESLIKNYRPIDLEKAFIKCDIN